MVPRQLALLHRLVVAGAVLLAATRAHTTPFFFCESLPDAPGRERHQGWGSDTLGSPAGSPIIHVGPAPTCPPGPPPSETDSVAAIETANVTPSPTIVFPANQTIRLTERPPALTANNVTILGNGATIRGDDMEIHSRSGAMLQIRGHDVIIRDLHFRNGGNDNLSIHGPNAYNVVVTHISSTGAADDGLSISNTCPPPPGTPPPPDPCNPAACDPERPFDTVAPHDITIQYSFFAGNTRSMFIKANNPATTVERVSVHHNWLTKQWVRGPVVDKSHHVDYVNNLVEDWAAYGVKFFCGARGNVAYNLFRQSAYAVTLGQLVDPECRMSTTECAFNGNPNCPYVVDDPNENNQKNAFQLGGGSEPHQVYTNNGLLHTNWYLPIALKRLDGTASAPFGVCRLPPRPVCHTNADCPGTGNACDLPEVYTLHQHGHLRDTIEARMGPCILTDAQVDAWERGEHVVCPRHPIDQAYLDADEWCVNAEAPFRP